MFDISYYYIVRIGKSIDLLLGNPPSDKTKQINIVEKGLSIKKLKDKYKAIIDQINELTTSKTSDYVFLWFEDGKWNAFDISKLPEMSSWDTLREATGKYDI